VHRTEIVYDQSAWILLVEEIENFRKITDGRKTRYQKLRENLRKECRCHTSDYDLTAATTTPTTSTTICVTMRNTKVTA
jgi:hypothetical protein